MKNVLKKFSLSLVALCLMISVFTLTSTPPVYANEAEEAVEAELNQIDARNTTWRVGDRGSVRLPSAILWRNATSIWTADRIGLLLQYAQVQVLMVNYCPEAGQRVKVLVQGTPGHNGWAGSRDWWVNTSALTKM